MRFVLVHPLLWAILRSIICYQKELEVLFLIFQLVFEAQLWNPHTLLFCALWDVPMPTHLACSHPLGLCYCVSLILHFPSLEFNSTLFSIEEYSAAPLTLLWDFRHQFSNCNAQICKPPKFCILLYSSYCSHHSWVHAIRDAWGWHSQRTCKYGLCPA